jgi:hypothetical protein
VREDDVSDPLRWWPGKYADCKRIAQLVEDLLPRGEVLECGGPDTFADLLPAFSVTSARIRDGLDLCRLPWDDGSFDVGVSARVLELLPPRVRPGYLREMVRVCRYSVFVALPLQPELEAIDKIKNTYIWDTPRVWRHPGPRPDDIESAIEGCVEYVTFHIEPPRGTEIRSRSGNEWIESLLASPGMQGSEVVPLIPTPEFVIAEIVKTEISARSLAVPSGAAH